MTLLPTYLATNRLKKTILVSLTKLFRMFIYLLLVVMSHKDENCFEYFVIIFRLFKDVNWIYITTLKF
jgi:hypothetical protein